MDALVEKLGARLREWKPETAAQVRERGAEVIVECNQPLVRLFAGVKGVSRVIARGESLPPYDLHCPICSLPRVMGTRLDSIPAPVPYLKAEPALAEQWRGRLSRFAGLRVGLVWGGNPLKNMPVLDSAMP